MPTSKTYSVERLDESQIKQLLRLNEEDLARDRLIAEREALHHLHDHLLQDLASAPSDTWILAAAISDLQAKNCQSLGDTSMAKAHQEQANDCELHAYRLMSRNNGRVVNHIRKLQKR